MGQEFLSGTNRREVTGTVLQSDSSHNPTWDVIIASVIVLGIGTKTTCAAVRYSVCDAFDELQPSEGRSEPPGDRCRPSL